MFYTHQSHWQVRLQLQENLDVDLSGRKTELFKLFSEVINEHAQVDSEETEKEEGESDDETPNVSKACLKKMIKEILSYTDLDDTSAKKVGVSF